MKNVERHDAYDVFIYTFLPLISCLDDLVLASLAEWN